MLIPMPPHRWTFQYRNYWGDVATRTVIAESLEISSDPSRFYCDVWVLNAMCLDRQERRSFALSAFLGPITEVLYTYKDSQDPDQSLPSIAQVADAVGAKDSEFGRLVQEVKEAAQADEADERDEAAEMEKLFWKRHLPEQDPS